MDDSAEMIRNQMEETRSQLSEKLETLENQVANTVQSTTTAVSDTVEAVKVTVEQVTEHVQETVQSVSEAFNLRLQTDRHPWIVFGGSVALGCLAARLYWGPAKKSQPKSPRTEPRPPQFPAEAKANSGNGHQTAESPSGAPAKSRASEASQESSWFGQQLGRLKGLAIGSFMGVVRDMAWRGLPEGVGQQVAEEVDSLTRQLGGSPSPRTVGIGARGCSQEEKETAEAAQNKVRWRDDGGQG